MLLASVLTKKQKQTAELHRSLSIIRKKQKVSVKGISGQCKWPLPPVSSPPHLQDPSDPEMSHLPGQAEGSLCNARFTFGQGSFASSSVPWLGRSRELLCASNSEDARSLCKRQTPARQTAAPSRLGYIPGFFLKPGEGSVQVSRERPRKQELCALQLCSLHLLVKHPSSHDGPVHVAQTRGG